MFSYKEWKRWVFSIHWTMRWFVLLVLIRPLLDSFQQFKEISPFISPLYIVGALTPILVIFSLIKMKRPARSRFDQVFGLFSFFIVTGSFLVAFYEIGTLKSIQFLLKLTLPVYLFYYLRRFIRSRKDLDGIITTFMFSAVFVVCILLYEVTIGPIRVVESRGLERIQGYYGDVMNYSIYITMTFLCACYSFFLKNKQVRLNKRLIKISIVASIGILGLIKINHAASLAIFSFIMLLFVQFNLKANRSVALFIILLSLVGTGIFGREFLASHITPLVQKDVQVWKGEKEDRYLLHGRVGRWQMMWTEFSRQNMFIQFAGYPLLMKYSYHYVGVGSHNDYIRILFLSGYFGLMSFLLMLYSIFRRALKQLLPLRFLILGALGVLLLYAISTTPTFYAPLMYIILSIFAFNAIPKK